MEKDYEVGKIEKAGVFAFTQNGITFEIAGFDAVDATRFMPPGTWNLISPPNDVRFYRAQGDEETVKAAFLASGRKIEKVFQVVDGVIDFSFLDREKEICEKCGVEKVVGMECPTEFWGRTPKSK